MKTLLALLILIIVGVLGYNYYQPHIRVSNPQVTVTSKYLKPQVIGTQEVCGSNAPACIRINLPDKQYELNDFKMYDRDCIAFISLPDYVGRSYCGPYKLQWIGPETTRHDKTQ